MTDVLGYISQCELCGQRAITLAPHKDWACPRCAEVAEPSPYIQSGPSGNTFDNPGPAPAPTSHQKAAALQDSVKHTCELCGRTGSRRFTSTATGWQCKERAACARRRGDSDIPAKPIPAEATPVATPKPAQQVTAPPQRHSDSGITARCTDCGRTWNLTGRVLKTAIDTHEYTKQHIVDVHPQAYAS